MEKVFVNKIDDSELKKRTVTRSIDIRGDYYRDQTAIIHSMPFRRMKRKTQVFFAPSNDHICTRIEHVLHVTSVATTICKGLNLDVELAQAIALGHDLGHPPFGHVGEQILNEIQVKNGYKFIHELNSYRLVEYLANKGLGLDLCYAVKDGIISHCGEKFERTIEPDFKIIDLDTITERSKYPCTYEGCVVRLSDKISYLGRDIEDAMRLNIVTENNIDKEILNILGISFKSLKDSVNSLVIKKIIYDAIDYSYKNEVIGVSENINKIMKIIKDFNYRIIYNSKALNDYSFHVKQIINIIYHELSNIFEKYSFDTEKYKELSIEPFRDFGKYLTSYKNFYLKSNTNANTIIIDYIAGMTDNFAMDFCKKVVLPGKIF